MLEDLIKVRNTMNMIETRGNSTIVMAECMTYLDKIIIAASTQTEGDD